MLRLIKNFFIIAIAIVPGFLAGTLYYEKPADFNPSIETSICFIQYEDKFLMLHRQDYKPEGNTWGVPGGKLDKSETPMQAVVREIFEETTLNIAEDKTSYVGEVYLRTSNNDVILHVFVSETPPNPEKVHIAFKEHKGFTWVTSKDALKMNLMQDEEKLIELIYGKVDQE